MSYQVLARKYRPLSFEAMVGQEHVVQALANALEQQRLHHAYLFTGTRGIGKADMKLNAAMPDVEVDPETYEVRADGELLTCEPARELPMAQRYFLY